MGYGAVLNRMEVAPFFGLVELSPNRERRPVPPEASEEVRSALLLPLPTGRRQFRGVAQQVKPVHTLFRDRLIALKAGRDRGSAELEVQRRCKCPDFGAERSLEVGNGVTDGTPGFWHGDVLALRIQEIQVLVGIGVVIGLLRREEFGRVAEFAPDDEGSPPGLWGAVIGGTKLLPGRLETHLGRGLEDLGVLRGSQYLRDVLNDEDLRPGPFDDLHIGSPHLLTDVVLAVLIEEAEALAGGAADDNVGLWDPGVWVLQDGLDVADGAMVAEVEVVGICGELVEVIGPDGLEGVAGIVGKPNGEAAGTGE